MYIYIYGDDGTESVKALDKIEELIKQYEMNVS